MPTVPRRPVPRRCRPRRCPRLGASCSMEGGHLSISSRKAPYQPSLRSAQQAGPPPAATGSPFKGGLSEMCAPSTSARPKRRRSSKSPLVSCVRSRQRTRLVPCPSPWCPRQGGALPGQATATPLPLQLKPEVPLRHVRAAQALLADLEHDFHVVGLALVGLLPGGERHAARDEPSEPGGVGLR